MTNDDNHLAEQAPTIRSVDVVREVAKAATEILDPCGNDSGFFSWRTAGHDGRQTVFYKDIGKEFLDADRNLPGEIMRDYLHLTAKGYDIWGQAVRGDIEKVVK